MSLVRVRKFWLNPDKVIGIWVEHVSPYRDDPDYWNAVLKCEEGTMWRFRCVAEEDAYQVVDELAAQVNVFPARGLR